MKLIPIIRFFCYLLCSVTTLAGQLRFDCDGKILIATNNGTTTSIYNPRSLPFTPPFLSILANYAGNFDALGFNAKDNFVYGVEQNTNNIVRLSLYNGIDRIGQVNIVDTLKVNAGDCTAEGLYVCYDYGLNQILVFDVVNNFSLLRRIDLFWDPSSPNQGTFKTRLYDLAFDPNDITTAYSYQGRSSATDLLPDTTKGSMLKINLNPNDPKMGMVTPLGRINEAAITHISGLAFDPKSNLFGYGSSLGGINPLQNNLFSIYAFPGQIAPFLTNSPAAKLSDACSCPFSLSFTIAVPNEGMYCNNDVKNFVIRFDNNSYISVDNITLKDTFPEGTVIKSISSSFNGSIDVGSGIGTNLLSISGLTIPAKGKIEIIVELMSVNAKDGPVYNQAFLQNLPPRFPTFLSSDDPTSSAEGDRSNFYFTTRDLTKVSWKTIPATNCLKSNDGKIIVTSADFLPGQVYEVSLRNKIGWSEYIINIVIDANNSFTIDSLLPGNYQLFRFRSMNDNCSVSLKDTTLILEAPNELLDLQVSSNSPVCEGEVLQLNSMMSADGIIRWEGPESFGSGTLNPTIQNINQKKKGKYEAEAKYGFCSQKRTLEVDVKQQIDITVEGDTSYCVRDKMRLEVMTDDGGVKHEWDGPNGLKRSESVLTLVLADDTQTGYYEVISGNGACYDTAGRYITVLPTPSLTLDSIITTDYCDAITMFPAINSSKAVSYQWLPKEGLSCDDCLNPQIEPIIQSRYRLKITNEYLCTDSASTQINLDKDKIAFSPNIFSPDAFGFNKEFVITPNCVVHYIQGLEVYDRLGNLVCHKLAKGPVDGILSWDGQSMGRRVSSGVYVWVAKVELVDGSIEYLRGDVTVL